MKTVKVAIVTDSTACIPQQMAAEYRIEVVPLMLIFGKESFRDGVDLAAAEFYNRLRTSHVLPTTSGAATLPYLETFTRAAQYASTILCITLSAKFSAMFSSAKIARDMAIQSLPGTTINVVDCQTAAGAQGLIVMAAAKAAANGQSLTEVTEVVHQLMGRVNLYAMLDTLKYLVKGGRAPRGSDVAASLLQIKPILNVQNGEAHNAATVLTVPAAMQYLFRLLNSSTSTHLPLHVVVMHADAVNRAQNLYSKIQKELQPVESWLGEFSPVMGVHTGPGLVGVAYYRES